MWFAFRRTRHRGWPDPGGILMMRLRFCVVLSLVAFPLLTLTTCASADEVWLSALDLTKMRQGWGEPHADQSLMAGPITIAGKKYERGVATHAKSVMWLELDAKVREFLASAGVDDTATGGTASVEFMVIGDGKSLWRSGVMHHGQEAQSFRVEVQGVRNLLLLVSSAGDASA